MAKPTNQIKDAVITALQTVPRTRESDRYLTVIVYQMMGVDTGAPFSQIIMESDLPSLETISRQRRKLQVEYPELRPSDKVAAWRAQKAKEEADRMRDQRKLW